MKIFDFTMNINGDIRPKCIAKLLLVAKSAILRTLTSLYMTTAVIGCISSKEGVRIFSVSSLPINSRVQGFST